MTSSYRRNNCNDDILVLSMARLVAEGVESWDVFGVQQRIIDLTYYIIKEGIGMADRCLDRIFVGWEMVKDETKYACVMLPPYDTGFNTIPYILIYLHITFHLVNIASLNLISNFD